MILLSFVVLSTYYRKHSRLHEDLLRDLNQTWSGVVHVHAEQLQAAAPGGPTKLDNVSGLKRHIGPLNKRGRPPSLSRQALRNHTYGQGSIFLQKHKIY